MKNSEFRWEVAGTFALLCGVIIVLVLSCIGNPAALGENMYWIWASIVFAISALICGTISFTVLTLLEKHAPANFLKIKRNLIVKSSRLMESWFGGNEE